MFERCLSFAVGGVFQKNDINSCCGSGLEDGVRRETEMKKNERCGEKSMRYNRTGRPQYHTGSSESLSEKRPQITSADWIGCDGPSTYSPQM